MLSHTFPLSEANKDSFLGGERHAVSPTCLTCSDQSQLQLQSRALKVDRWGFMLSLVHALQSGVIHLAVNVYFHRDHLIPLVWPRKMQRVIITALIGTRLNVCRASDLFCVNKQAVNLWTGNVLILNKKTCILKHRQQWIIEFLSSGWLLKVQCETEAVYSDTEGAAKGKHLCQVPEGSEQWLHWQSHIIVFLYSSQWVHLNQTMLKGDLNQITRSIFSLTSLVSHADRKVTNKRKKQYKVS